MGERDLPLRPEEQYPLLKVDCGGDIAHPQATQIISPGWSVTCSKKQSWLSKWPEFISACWMTLILFGISFLVFYAIGMGAYRRQQFIIVKCNTSNPASNVFYHQIIQRGGQFSFAPYVDYLSFMASFYRNLHFHVIFLIDDSYQTARGPRHGRFINKFIPYYPYGIYNYKIDDANKQLLNYIQRKYPNINVTFIPLSKYMAMTPLKYRWKVIPSSVLAFYVRAFAVWENGGIGMDLVEYTNKFENQHLSDRRISAILQQHNDGINPDEYANELSKIDKDEQTAILSMFYGMINQFLNETKSFINRTLSYSPTEKTLNEPLVRSHRSNRDLNESAVVNSSESKPVTSDATFSNINQDDTNVTNDVNVISASFNTVYPENEGKGNLNNESNSKMVTNNTETSKIVLFYDFSVFSDNIGPPYVLSDPVTVNFGAVKNKNGKHGNSSKSASYLLSINAEGTFVAAAGKLHPFLGYLMSMGCQRMVPKIAIQDALFSQCSGLLKNDIYCNNIYIL